MQFTPMKPHRSSLPFVLSVLSVLSHAHAATLTAVPMQGGMAMPMVAYHAEHGHLHVMMPTDVPALIPLLASNPADRFDPADPWFDALDPSRQGLAFSRRYGFVMDTATDPLPAATTIWIRKLSGPPELGFYRYSGSAPKAWEPLFGTAGSPEAMPWNGMMFHPGITAPAGTNGWTATFELYLVNDTTGLTVPDSSSGPLTFNWTTVPDGRPALVTGLRTIVAWPADATGYVLESTDALAGSPWTVVTNTPVTVDGQPAILLEPGLAHRFFRMRKTP